MNCYQKVISLSRPSSITTYSYVSKRNTTVEDCLENQRVENDEQEVLAHRADFERRLAVRTFEFGQRTHKRGQEGQEDEDEQDGNVVDDQVGSDGANVQNPTEVWCTSVSQAEDDNVAEERDNGGPKEGNKHDQNVDTDGGNALQPAGSVEVVPLNGSGRHRSDLGVPVLQLDCLLHLATVMLS
jgi:E3 ubiquitin-protein ligase DOA10